MAVSWLLRAYPSGSIGLKPSNGGSLTVQSFAGGGLGELRPDADGASLMADGAMVGRRGDARSWVGGGQVMARGREVVEWIR
tara:strand:+ start:22404 stop:22649 length:246 start_codon:yes stop_codon:yes gene_type:complete